MAPSIGLNLRVTGYKHQGGRRYMEDDFGVAYQQTADEKDLEYAFFGIFDGHGGREAAAFAKEHLMDYIVSQKGFWEEDDESVLKAIREGFIQTHYAMWKELEKWPKTASGLPSTAGTTASIAFIRRGKIYIGHVGDSAIVLGVQDPDNPDVWLADPLTIDHKPESLEESERIIQSGGKVVCKSGVPRVVWNRPKMGHQGPVRRSTHIDEIPFLAVARSLGDLWSYNSEENVFVVSPEPDCRVYPVDITKHRCLILATDGAWNMMTPQNSVSVVCKAEKSNEQHMLNPVEGKTCWINPSKMLVDTAIERWINSKLRADNTSVVTVMLDPPGPPRAQVLKNRQRELAELNSGRDASGIQAGDRGSIALVTNTSAPSSANSGNLPPSVPGPSTSSRVVPPPQQPGLPGMSGGPPIVARSSSMTAAATSRVPVPPPRPSSSEGAASNVPGPSSSSSSAVESSDQQLSSPSVPGPSCSQQQPRPEPQKHCTIISRFPNSSHPDYSAGYDLIKQRQCHPYNPHAPPPASASPVVPPRPPPATTSSNPATPFGGAGASPSGMNRVGGTLRDDTVVLRRSASPISSPAASSAMLRRSASPMQQQVASSSSTSTSSRRQHEDNVQCNEVSSSEDSPSHAATSRSGQSTPPPPPGQENILPTSSSSKLPQPNTRLTPSSPSTASSKKARYTARKSLCRELSSLHFEETRQTRGANTKVSPIIMSSRTTTRAARNGGATPAAASSPQKAIAKSPGGGVTKKKMLQKPVLSREKTQSLVQLRCLQITEKLEAAKSVSTRSLSLKKLSVMETREETSSTTTTTTKSVTRAVSTLRLNSPAAAAAKKLSSPRKLRSKEDSSNNQPAATPTAKAPKVAKTPATVSVKAASTPASQKKVPLRSTKSASKAKSPLKLRTPRAIDKHLKSNTPSRSLKLSRGISQLKLTPEPSPRQQIKASRSQPQLSMPNASPVAANSPILKKKPVATPKSKAAEIKAPMARSRSAAKAPSTSQVVSATPRSAVKRKISSPPAGNTPAKTPKLVRIETPVKVSKTPAKSPVKAATKTPAKSAKTPTRSAKTPARATKTPTRAAKTPVQTAAKTRQTPGGSTSKLSLPAAKPAKATPSKVTKTPPPPPPPKPSKAAPKKQEKVSPVKAAKKSPVKAVKATTPKAATKATPKAKSKDGKTGKSAVQTKTPDKSAKKVDDKKATPANSNKKAVKQTPASSKKSTVSPKKSAKQTPARTPKAVTNKKPLITRSKQAMVLKLKRTK